MKPVKATTAKRSTNLSIRSELLKQARAMDINLSQIFETCLEQRIATQGKQAWLAKNQSAIEAYNAAVEKQGVFSRGRRRF
jgi:antitoxin CcdA